MHPLDTTALAISDEVVARVRELFSPDAGFDLKAIVRTQLEMADRCIALRPDVIVVEAIGLTGLRVLVETLTEGRPVTTIAIIDGPREPTPEQKAWFKDGNVAAISRSVFLRTDAEAEEHLRGRLERAVERQRTRGARASSSLDLDELLDEDEFTVVSSRPATDLLTILDGPLRAAMFLGGAGALEAMVGVMRNVRRPEIPLLMAFEHENADGVALALAEVGFHARVLNRGAQWRELAGPVVVPTDHEVSITRTGLALRPGRWSRQALFRWLPEDRSVALVLLSDDERTTATVLGEQLDAGRLVLTVDPMTCRYTRGPVHLAGAGAEVLTPSNVATLVSTASRLT